MKYYCEKCGKLISEADSILFNNLCDKCFYYGYKQINFQVV